MKYFFNLLIVCCIAFGFIACDDNDKAWLAQSLTIDQEELQFSGYHESKAVKLDATRHWRAVPSDYWITVTPDGYPTDGQHFVVNVAVSVADNDSGNPREGYVSFYIGDELIKTLTVKQDKQKEEERPEEQFPITWANLQWAASITIVEGTPFEAGCCVFANGITNTLESTTGEKIIAQIGFSAENSRPDDNEWQWADCWFNGDWGDNFYYQGKIEAPLTVGTYYYTFRTRNGNGPWRYAGTNGLWDGVENVSGTFEVKAKPTEDIDYSNYAITWANLQWFAAEAIETNGMFEAGSQIYIDGLTNREEAAVDGMGVIGEIGYSKSQDPKDADWVWTEGWWNGDWGNNFYYQGKTPEIAVDGTYYWTFRFKMGKDGEWAYAGTDGLWDGVSNVCGSFTVGDSSEEPDISQYTITWTNIQWWANEEITVGSSLEAGSKVKVDGLSDAVESKTGEGVICEIGYSATDTNPSGEGWVWKEVSFNGDWGAEFYFQGTADSFNTAGTYYYAFRSKLGRNGTYVYAGTNGIWDGVNNTSRSITVK